MKRNTYFTAIISLLIITSVNSANAQRQDHIWDFSVNNQQYTVGLYGGLTGSYFEFAGDPAGMLSYQAGIVINGKFGIGLTGSGLYYDQQMPGLVADGSYHVNSGWNGGYIERMFTVTPRLRASLAWESGRGLFFYRYDNEFRAEKLWHEEIIDGDTYFVNKPTIKAHFRVAGNWWLGLEAAYTLASPVKAIAVDEKAMNGFSTGISLSYGIF